MIRALLRFEREYPFLFLWFGFVLATALYLILFIPLFVCGVIIGRRERSLRKFAVVVLLPFFMVPYFSEIMDEVFKIDLRQEDHAESIELQALIARTNELDAAGKLHTDPEFAAMFERLVVLTVRYSRRVLRECSRRR